jgi:hypothetical protein
MLKRILPIFIPSFVILFFHQTSYSAVPPASQQMSGQERSRQMQQEEESLRKQVESESAKTKPAQETTQEVTESPTAEKVLIKNITL